MKKVIIMLVAVVLLAVANFVSADTFGTGTNQFTIDFVNISGDASSANGTYLGHDKTFNDPSNDYRMGTYEVTNDQWDKFQDSYGTVTGSPSRAYDSDSHWTGTNVPTTNVSWLEATQFVNWLNTSTGHNAAYRFKGTREAGDYRFIPWQLDNAGYDSTNPYRNSNAFYFLPTESEWVKAAYWNGTNLQTFATTDDSMPLLGVDTNYRHLADNPLDVGSGSEELNGTFDMMGNVSELTESPYRDYYDRANISRILRGGCYWSSDNDVDLYGQTLKSPDNENISIGFRVASIPEPSSLVLLSLGAFALKRKRKA